MTPRQRILATLDRDPVDRPPVDLWLTPEVLRSLQDRFAEPDELALYQRLGVDKIVFAFPGYGSGSFDPNDRASIDPWGVPTVEVRSGLASYHEYAGAPLADYTDPAQLSDYPGWPDPDRYNYPGAVQQAREARARGFATIGPWLSHFETYCHLRGMENALMDVVAEPDFLRAALDRIDDIQTRMLERYLREMGDLVDLIFISDDMGTQESQLISPAAWCEHLKPRLARWCELIHAHGKRVLFHSDGACRPFVPHLIECGVDVLNPIQHICPGMDRAALKRDFGSKIIFHGGIENQSILPRGTVEEVRRETTACLETLGADGGYIPCSCHFVQAGTPPENVLALLETVHGRA